MQQVISKIQKDGVVWLQDSVLRTYRPSPTDFVHALHKVYILFVISFFKTVYCYYIMYIALFLLKEKCCKFYLMILDIINGGT